MKARKPQNFEMPNDGLFGDAHKQTDLLDYLNGAGWLTLDDESKAKMKAEAKADA